MFLLSFHFANWQQRVILCPFNSSGECQRHFIILSHDGRGGRRRSSSSRRGLLDHVDVNKTNKVSVCFLSFILLNDSMRLSESVRNSGRSSQWHGRRATSVTLICLHVSVVIVVQHVVDVVLDVDIQNWIDSDWNVVEGWKFVGRLILTWPFRICCRFLSISSFSCFKKCFDLLVKKAKSEAFGALFCFQKLILVFQNWY